MYDTEGNKHHIFTGDNLFHCQQSHQYIDLKETKQVLQCNNSRIVLYEKRLPFI